jgi:ATP-dependent RNA helicase RhlE
VIHFDALSLHPALLAATRAAGFTEPTPIQAEAIPLILAGRDVLGCAQTGTGKTAAFALPLLQRLAASAQRMERGRRPIRALVLSPTRELATQICEAVDKFGAAFGLCATAVFGGVSVYPHPGALSRAADALVATPGRLEDLMRGGAVDLRAVEIAVLDEADRMLDSGFLSAVRRILGRCPRSRQTLLFSATMPEEIRSLARAVQRDAAEIRVAPVATPAETVEQEVLFVARSDKRKLLEQLLSDPAVTRALVFTRTKRGADRVARDLSTREEVPAIHGNRSQVQRERALAAFRSGRSRVLVATDLAARGIDVDGISHVINYELPDDCESYVHRIGRTGRAKAAGVAWTLCASDERDQLRRIERLMRRSIRVREAHAFADRNAAPARPLPGLAPGAGFGRNRRGAHESAPREREQRRRQQHSHESGNRNRPEQNKGAARERREVRGGERSERDREQGARAPHRFGPRGPFRGGRGNGARAAEHGRGVRHRHGDHRAAEERKVGVERNSELA